MKKLIFISIVMSLVATAAQSQVIVIPEQDPPGDWPGGGPGNPGVTNYYPNTTGTITKSGYTYKYRNYKLSSTGFEIASRIQLYNANAIYLDTKWGYKDGTEKSEGESMGYYKDSYYFSYCSQTYDQLRAIVAGKFTAQQKTALKESTMIVQALVDPATGKVVDVYFSFRRSYPLVNIPVETFRNIELALKEKLTITATANGRKFNYIEFIWQQRF